MAVASAAPLSFIFGDRETGKDVRTANVTAVQSVANVLKSTLGPQGLDKMMVDDIGDVTISNDGATILRQLEVQHPAAKLLVDLSDLQDKEVGDGTTSVVLLAAELLKRANNLVIAGIHPTNIIAGYKLAMKECVKYIQANLSHSIDQLGQNLLLNIAQTSFNSKYIGAEGTHFAQIVVRALQNVKMVNERGETKYPVRAINVLKTHGQGSRDSTLVDGCALARTSRASQGMPTSVKDAQIALLDFNLRQHRMQLGVQVQVEDPEELEKIRQKEKDVTKAKIEKILAAGATVIVTSQGIDDLALKYFVEAKTIAVRRVDRKDLRRLAKATGATICSSMACLNSEEEAFDSSLLGQCDEVCEERVGDWDYLFFKGCRKHKGQSIILRGANDFMLDEIERSLHDALCAVSRALESDSVCAGGGSVEVALSIYLEDFARTLGTREQVPIAEFANALLVIPKTLAVNAAQDATELVARLRMKHHESQHATTTGEERRCQSWGLDLINGEIRNSVEAGVVEPTVTKIKAIRFATEAAVTVLRIDDVIKLHPEPEPQPQE